MLIFPHWVETTSSKNFMDINIRWLSFEENYFLHTVMGLTIRTGRSYWVNNVDPDGSTLFAQSCLSRYVDLLRCCDLYWLLIMPFKNWSIFHWAAEQQNQQNYLCSQGRLRSAWASAQSDQSLPCPPEETLGPSLPIERTAKTLIRLGRCPGWSESSLGAHVILLVLSCGSSYCRQ